MKISVSYQASRKYKQSETNANHLLHLRKRINSLIKPQYKLETNFSDHHLQSDHKQLKGIKINNKSNRNKDND